MRVIGDVVNETEHGDNPDYLLINDFNTILRNAGVSKEDYFNNQDANNKAHEFFAQSFETYLSEGNAPTVELVNAFERIRQWFVEVYRDIKEALGIELNDEMRDFFDRLLATPEQAAEQKSIEQINSLYEATQEELQLTQEDIERLEAEGREIEAQQEFLDEIASYEEPTIPTEILERVNKYLEDKAHEGIEDEQFLFDLSSTKSKRAKSELFANRSRQLQENIYAPYIEVNTDTLNAFLSQAGIDATRNYLVERSDYIKKLIKNLQKRLPDNYSRVLSQQSKVDELVKRRDKLKNLEDNEKVAAINNQLENERGKLKQAQEAYNTVKSDIDALVNEQKEISDSTDFINRNDANAEQQNTNNISNENAVMTLADAINKGYEMAERYAGEIYQQARNEQKAISEAQARREIANIRDENADEIREINRQNERELDNQALLLSMAAKDIRDKDAAKIAKLKESLKAQKAKDREILKSKIAALKERQKQLKQRQRERDKIRKDSDKLVKAINRMAKAQNISWGYQEKIRNLLETHDKINKKNYSLRDLQFIHSQIKEFYDIGKRELAEKKLADKERINALRQKIRESGDMLKDWNNRPKGVPTSAKDAQKQYKGIKGRVSKILDWSVAKTFGAQRFFDYMDGNKNHKGAWIEQFVDRPNAAMNEKLLNVFRRQKAMEDKLLELGIDANLLAETRNINVPKKNGELWTVEELIGIYAGLQNTKSREAILFGNFAEAESYEQAQEWANEAVAALNDNEKALGDFIIEEYEQHFERLNNFSIDNFNQGLNHEERYTPVRRLEFTTNNSGMVNPDAAESDLNPASFFGRGMGKVERGFMQSRVDFKENKQPGIDLHIFNIWNNQIEAQEHAMAFYPLVRDLRQALLSKNKGDDATVRQMIKETRGKYAWEMVQQYFNIIATNETMQAYNTLDDVTRYLSKNMSVAYLCGNLGTALKQWNSFFFVMPYAAPNHIINSIGECIQNPKAFLEECAKLDPQLKVRNGDPFIQELRKGSGVIYDNLLKWASTPIGLCDKLASSIVFKAVYNANIKNGLSQNDAIKEAHRVVELTQPPAHAKNKPLIWQQHGYARLAMMFTNSLANIYGITLYDLTTAIKNGEIPKTLATAVGLTLAAMMIYGLSSGSDDDDDSWLEWIAKAVSEQTINSIPLIGKELMTLWDYRKGFFRNNQSAFVAPFAKLLKGSRGLSDDKAENNERAVWDLIEGGSLLYPFPVTGLHRVYNAIQELGNGEVANIFKRIFGMRVEKKKMKKAVSF